MGLLGDIGNGLKDAGGALKDGVNDGVDDGLGKPSASPLTFAYDADAREVRRPGARSSWTPSAG
ncbi:hypothetical protein [Streptomyces sp. NPDC049813]|uniref:hypothetical protein n=1 Tax=Streptomyces sp. NPDC049813 TaxID=3365597 RepID=UPI0037AD2C9B